VNIILEYGGNALFQSAGKGTKLQQITAF